MTLTDSERFAAYGSDLAAAVEQAVPGWIRRAVYWHLGDRVADESFDREALDRRLDDIGQAAAGNIGGRLRQLLQRDVDEQWTNPLSIIRSVVHYPTEILNDYNVPGPDRWIEHVRMFPNDTYDLTPANFAAFGDDVHQCGIRWGAAKAHIHLQRHKKS